MPSELERHAGALYGGALGEFVAARNRLAHAVKAGGAPQLATAIKALPKPSASAWAIDQLWWHERPTLDALLSAAAELRAVLVGGAGPQEAARVRNHHRERVAAATSRAAERLEAAGHNVTIALRRRVATSLEALAALGRWPDPGPGCLADDLDPPGFDALGGMPVMPHVAPESTQPAAQEAATDDANARRIAEAETALREAAALIDRRTREHDEAEQERAREHAEHEAAAARLRAAERDLDRARAALGAAETRARRHAEALQSAHQAHDAASATLARLRARSRATM